MGSYVHGVVVNTYRCAECFMIFGISEDMESARRSDHKGFYCPSGHEQSFKGESEMNKLHKKIESLENDLKYANQATERANIRVSTYKGQVTKLRKKLEGMGTNE